MTAHASHTIDCDAALPGFTAAYLRVAGDECAFIETYTTHALPRLMAALKAHGKKPEDVRWVVVTHAHLDHAGGASAVLEACPRATLLAHPRAARHLVDPAKLIAGATAVYGESKFREMYGEIRPIPAGRVRALEDGETFALGDATLRVLHTAGHANHHFVVHDPALDTVFTGDTFGLVYPALQKRGRFAFPSTSPSNFEPVEAKKSVDRVMGLGAKVACPTHFGEIRDLDEIATQLHAWLDRAEGWLDAAVKSTDSVAALTSSLAGAWRAAIAKESDARALAFDEAAFGFLELDIDLNAQGIAVVADMRRKRASASK